MVIKIKYRYSNQLFKRSLFYSVCFHGWTGQNCTNEISSWNEWYIEKKCPNKCVVQPTMLLKRTCKSPNIVDCAKTIKKIVDLNITRCDKIFCRLNGTWTSWSTWSACRKTCGVEKSTRDRYCYFDRKILFEVPGLYNKEKCEGNHTLYRDCGHVSCIIFVLFHFLGSTSAVLLVFSIFFFKSLKPLYEEIKRLKALLKVPEKDREINILISY